MGSRPARVRQHPPISPSGPRLGSPPTRLDTRVSCVLKGASHARPHRLPRPDLPSARPDRRPLDLRVHRWPGRARQDRLRARPLVHADGRVARPRAHYRRSQPHTGVRALTRRRRPCPRPLTPPSTATRPRRSRPRPSNWPMWPPTTPPARPRTPSRCSTATRPRPTTARWSAARSRPRPATSSSALCHQGHNGHGPLERRYLVVPGIRSSRIYVLDIKPDPRNPRVVREITAEELAAKAGYSRPHTVHCGPGGIFVFALGGANGNDGPGGIALLDHDTFDVVGAWELDRGDQFFGYDGWWHLNYDTVITSEWATPSMIENGLNPEDLLGRKFGHHLNFWSMSQRTLTQRIDLGDAHQMVLEVRPAHDPAQTWGFVGVVISVEDLSGSVWLWHRDGDRWAATKVITIPAEPADPDQLPPALKPFGAVPPLISDIDLSVDDRWLYVSCWGTGELKQYDVADIF